MEKLIIDGCEANIIETDIENNMVLAEYMVNDCGRIRLIQEWKIIV